MGRAGLASYTRRKPPVRNRILLPVLLGVFLSGVITYHTNKPLPAGLSYEGPVRYAADVDFLYDLTYKKNGMKQQEQQIFDRIFQTIEAAEQFIVIDMFLFNGYYDADKSFPRLSATLTDKLIAQKQRHPNLHIVFISDEVNTTYGGHPAPELERLKANGIETVITDMGPLRDSTPLYSGAWRVFLQWFSPIGEGWIRNPMADTAPKISIPSYLKLLNVKANHRKLIATEKSAIITSANPHDASSLHSNIAFEAKGELVNDILASEQAVANFSGGNKLPENTAGGMNGKIGEVEIRLLTEGKIYQHLLNTINYARSGDILWMGMFYLADREVVEGLLDAASRGVDIRLILDPNQNAFGQKKIGIPNRPVASELLEKSKGKVKIRWYNTGEEQYHAKLMLLKSPVKSIINGGSANFTPRNLDDLNLETNLEIAAAPTAEVIQETEQYFNRIWTNEGGEYTLDYSAYEEKTTPLKKFIYWLQNVLGFTTF